MAGRERRFSAVRQPGEAERVGLIECRDVPLRGVRRSGVRLVHVVKTLAGPEGFSRAGSFSQPAARGRKIITAAA
jgi:hypothetical protein